MLVQEFNKLDKNDYIIIKLIMTTRLILGLYSKLHKSFAFAVIARLYCIVYAIVLMYLCKLTWVADEKYGTFYLIILKIVNFNLVLIVAHLSDGENFFNYLEESDKVDPLGLTKIEKHKVLFCFPVFIGVLGLNLFRSVIASQFFENFGMILIVTNTLMTLTSHLSHMTRILMFEILWIRVKSLRIAMGDFPSTSNLDNERQVKSLTMKLVEYLLIYRRLLQNIKNIGNAPKFLMLMALPNCFIVLLSTVDIVSGSIKAQLNSIFVIETLLNIALPCLPAVFGELCSAEADKIKSNLIRRYRNFNNDALRNKISDGIKFLEISPMKFTVWRIFPVNCSLLLSLISIYTTYTIVLLQFNQLNFER